MKIKKLIIRQPDDMHVHFRSGEILQNVAPFTTHIFGRAVAMGNLPVPITTPEMARAYREEIKDISPKGFNPIMSVIMTKDITPEKIKEIYKAGVKVLKLIPASTSTNSSEGIILNELRNYLSVLEMVKKVGMIFSVHFELIRNPKTGKEIPEIQREEAAIPFLRHLVLKASGLKIVVEHASTRKIIEFVKKAPWNVAATLTAHHALVNYGDVFNPQGRIKDPFLYCKPIAKTADDQEAVIEAMTSGNPKFFFGSDSAPHSIWKKNSNEPPAGIFAAPVVIPLLCEIFEREKKLERLENFVSRFGAKFYGLPFNTGKIEIEREEWRVPDEIDSGVKIFKGGETLQWQVV
mgnify:CR=1 FL=1